MESEVSVIEKKPRNTNEFFQVPAERPILSSICSGGAGANAAKFMINEIDPEEDQTARIVVIESNGPVLIDHFHRKEDPKDLYTTRLFKWFDSGRFKIFPIGKGLGAGGNPEAGKKMFESHIDAVMEFIQGSDSVVQVGGAGGGTASGVMPLLAQALSNADISMYSILAFPRFDEGQDKIAKACAVRDLLTDIGPTTSVHNEEINLELDGSRPLSEIYRDIDNACLYPVLRLTRWLSQETGDVKDLDKSDFKNFLAYGNHILPGFFDAAKGLDGFEQAFLENRFLRTRIIENAAKILLCYRGEGWTYGEQNRVKQFLTSKMKKGLGHPDVECKEHVKEKGLPEGTKTVGFIAVAKEGPDENQGQKRSSVAVLALPASAPEVQPLAPSPELVEEPTRRIVVDRTNKKEIKGESTTGFVTTWVDPEDAKQFNALFTKNLSVFDKERTEVLLKKIYDETGILFTPRLPWSGTNGAVHSIPPELQASAM